MASSRNSSVSSFMQNGKAVAAGFLRQGAGQPTFADAGGADEEDVLMLPHPFAGGERAQQFAVEAAGCW